MAPNKLPLSNRLKLLIGFAIIFAFQIGVILGELK